MTILIWVFRALVILIVLRLLVRFIRAVIAGASAPRQTSSTKRPERLGGTLVRDPQCGTYVPPVRALSSGSGDSAVFFCSTDCRDAWVAAHRS